MSTLTAGETPRKINARNVEISKGLSIYANVKLVVRSGMHKEVMLNIVVNLVSHNHKEIDILSNVLCVGQKKK